jgi:CRISPR/Cas system-associated exonuclease Cas4 (RecB family)
MPLPPDFQFSQNNLQDYWDCPRRFQLKYLLHQPWPAIQSEPVLEQESRMELGDRFHRLVHQHQIGIDAELLSNAANDPELAAWWQNYLTDAPHDLPANRYSEHSLSAPFEGFRLIATYDLLAIEPGSRVVIVDWKTSRRQPTQQQLNDHLQSRVYPFLLVSAGAYLNGNQAILPEQVEMVYWFTEFPKAPMVLQYDAKHYEEDRHFLQTLVHEIVSQADGEFPLTLNEKHCRFCNYRSLCQRGVKAANLDPEAEFSESGYESPQEIDFEQIAEIEF